MVCCWNTLFIKHNIFGNIKPTRRFLDVKHWLMIQATTNEYKECPTIVDVFLSLVCFLLFCLGGRGSGKNIREQKRIVGLFHIFECKICFILSCSSYCVLVFRCWFVFFVGGNAFSVLFSSVANTHVMFFFLRNLFGGKYAEHLSARIARNKIINLRS